MQVVNDSGSEDPRGPALGTLGPSGARVGVPTLYCPTGGGSRDSVYVPY